MRNIVISCLIFIASSLFAEKAAHFKEASVDSNGYSVGVADVFVPKKINLGDNQYSISTWNSFGITNDISVPFPNIIKDGNVWRDMTPAEVATLNSNLQSEVTADAVEDAKWDAMLHTVAEAIKQGAKTYPEVKAIFENSVDPKKAKKEKK